MHSLEEQRPPLSARLLGRRCSGWFLYSAFAETHLTLGRIDFAARLRWLFYLLQSRTITGRANSFGHTLTRFFHSDQSLKQTKKLNRLPKIAPSGNSAMELAS